MKLQIDAVKKNSANSLLMQGAWFGLCFLLKTFFLPSLAITGIIILLETYIFKRGFSQGHKIYISRVIISFQKLTAKLTNKSYVEPLEFAWLT